jgi:hypothetical protein
LEQLFKFSEYENKLRKFNKIIKRLSTKIRKRSVKRPLKKSPKYVQESFHRREEFLSVEEGDRDELPQECCASIYVEEAPSAYNQLSKKMRKRSVKRTLRKRPKHLSESSHALEELMSGDAYNKAEMSTEWYPSIYVEEAPSTYQHKSPWFVPEEHSINNTNCSDMLNLVFLSPSICSATDACSICPVAVEYIEPLSTYASHVLCSSIEGNTPAPSVLADEMEYLHPDLAHCHTVTIHST